LLVEGRIRVLVIVRNDTISGSAVTHVGVQSVPEIVSNDCI
jgi:hypothetical protein